MNGTKLTSGPEIAAYLLTHFIGIAWAYLINPTIFAALIAGGYRGSSFQAVVLGMSVLTMFVVLLLFLGMRKLLTSSKHLPAMANVADERVKILGAYLTVASALQVFLYLAMSISPDRNDWLFYFDPRLGLSMFESLIRGAQHFPAIFAWVSAAWVLALGLILLSGRPLIMAYIISEVALSIPNLLFVFIVARANMSPAHGFSVGELFVPACVMIIFSVVPLILAFRARSRLTPPESNVCA